MNTKRWSVENMLSLSVAFTLLLLGLRLLYWQQFTFLFYVWNLFLAVIPLLLSRHITRCYSLNFKSVCLLGCWVLFLPNAPYIVTDIFHFFERPPVPAWYDLLLVTSAAWNGLIIGMVSLLQVESFLRRQLPGKSVNLLMTLIIFACSFGIFLGRFLRFNSWDVVTDTSHLFHSLAYQVFYPFQNVKTWAFTVLFGALLALVYQTIRRLAPPANMLEK